MSAAGTAQGRATLRIVDQSMEGFHAKLGNRRAGDGFNEVPVVLDEKKSSFHYSLRSARQVVSSIRKA